MVRAALFAVLAVLAGCASLAPTYERPTAPVPTTLPGDTGDSDAQVPALAAFVRAPALRTIMQHALAANRTLRRATLDIEAARAQYRIQRAAALPSIDVAASITSARQLTGGPDNATTTTTGASVLGLAAWEIDLFGRITSLADARYQDVLSTVELARAARVSLLAELATAYVTLAADQGRLEIAREAMANGKRVMEITDQLVGGGTSNRSDFYQAATVYQQGRADVALLTAAIEADKNALQLLAGGPIATDLLPTALPVALDWFAEVPVGLSSSVLLARPDVLAAEHQLMAANANIGAARAQFFPQVTLTASGGLASTALSALFSGPAFVFSIVPNLAMPLFRGGANRATLAATEANKAVLVAAYEGAIQRAFREVADALATRATIDEQLAAQTALVAAAQASFEIAQARYEAGIDPFLSTLVTQRALYAAQNSLIATQLSALANRVALYRALGGGR